ncbi:MAG TPA: MotA/TolQ/ExbB proton channel family protein [bacterium]|nr:MotA/TolQ/ExbB proton channel family protein [bacterium]
MGNGHIFQILWGADPVVKLTLFVLFGFSVASWAIIIYKHKELKKLRAASARFFDSFWRIPSLEELLAKYAGQESPLFNIFRQAAADVIRKPGADARQARGSRDVTADGMRRRIERAAEDEIERVERYIPFLATTGSTTPFIGLFGTVWGILAAFWQIGRAGSSSLAVVGPFIAEALIATAFGLAAAIPAVIFYNFFVNRTRIFTREIQSFSEDLAHRIERDYLQA